jgi:ABC-type uncharacterized transport system permease subunit
MNASLWLAFRLGARRGWGEKAGIIGQCAILWALIVSYGVLFRFIPAETLARLQITPPQLAWYLVLTQIIASLNMISGYQIMQENVRSGALEIFLLRPVDFWQLELGEWMGSVLVKITFAGAFAFGIGFWTTHTWLLHFKLLILIPILIAAAIIMMSAHLIIGCSTIWLSECRPVFWFWHKCQFLFGALLWPLLFYPHWLQKAVWFTPFPSTLAIAGNLALYQPGWQTALQCGIQLCWVVIMLLAARAMAKAVRHKLMKGG